jgi:phosphosulfolactate phosphohydrolase-like enzyme
LPKFDIGNSPVDLIDAISNGDYTKVALKTTNTTKRLANMKDETFIFSSTLNISATVDFLSNLDEKIKINLMAVGGRNGFTEDLSVVLSLYAILNDDIDINYGFLKDCIFNSKNARYLSSIGYSKDIEFIISKINTYDVVPMMVDGVIKPVQQYG